MDFIKVDVVLRKASNEFFDASCLYSLGEGESDADERLKELEHEFGELISEGKYWKALKRLFSMMRLRNEDPEMSLDLVRLFNSDIGKLYQSTSQMKAVQTLKWESNKLLKKQVEAFFQEVLGTKGSVTRSRIDNIIRSNEKTINKKAQEVLCSLI
jgi:hypothetical protein